MTIVTRSRVVAAATAMPLIACFVGILIATWERWGHHAVDCGGAVDRAARLAQGAVLYRDVLSPYGPIPPYVIAGLFRVFGIHLTVVYVTGIGLLAAGSACLWYVTRRCLSAAECAVGLVGFWVLLGFQPGLFNWILPNTFASVFGAFFTLLVVTLLVADLERPSPRKLIVASLVAALAGLSKVEFGLAAVGVTLTHVVLLPSPTRTRRWAIVLSLVPGLLVTVTVAAVLSALVPWQEIVFDNLYRVRSFARTVEVYKEKNLPPLWPMLRAALWHYPGVFALQTLIVASGLAIVSRGRWYVRVAGVVVALAALVIPWRLGLTAPPVRDFSTEPMAQFGWAFPVWLVVGIGAFVQYRRRPSPASGSLVLVAITSLLLAMRWDFHVAWAGFYGPFSPFLVLGMTRFVPAFVLPRTAPLAAALVVATAVVDAAGHNWKGHDVPSSMTLAYRSKTMALDYPRGRLHTNVWQGTPLKATIDYVRSHTRPGDYVAVIPEERFINFFSERPHPTRDPGVGPGWLATRDDEERFLREIHEKNTQLIVISTRVYPEFRAGKFDFYNRRVKAELDRSYVEVWRRGRYRVFARRQPG